MEVAQLLSDSGSSHSGSGRSSYDASPTAANGTSQTTAARTFDIDIYSDLICPWCYIGRKNLAKAVAIYQQQHGDAEFNLAWKPFLLLPNSTTSQYSKKVPFITKFGADRAPTFFDRVDEAGAEHGITFEWEGRTGNSRDAHKLILLAMDLDAAATTTTTNGAAAAAPRHPNTRQETVTLALFRGGFELGRDPSDRNFLIETALGAGLAASPADVLAWLDSDEVNRRIDAELARARAIRITAVPSFVVQGRYRVGGNQGPEVFLDLFDKIEAREREGMGEGIRA